MGVTIFNFSEHFNVLVADLLSIREPFVVRVDENLAIRDTPLNFRLLRVDAPSSSLLRNGKPISNLCQALTNATFSAS